MSKRTENPKVGDYRAFFLQRLQEDPEYRLSFINSCLAEADDPEVTEEEYLVTLVQCLKDVVESYGSVDKFLKRTNSDINRNTVYHLFSFLDDAKRKRGPDFSTVYRIFKAIGFRFMVRPAEDAEAS